MKRALTQKSKIEQVIREQNDGKVKCIAESSCKFEAKSFNSGNFKRHLKSKHPIIFDRLELSSSEPNSPVAKKRQKKLIVNSDAEQVLLGTLQLVTTGNSPYNFFESIAYKTLLKPLYDAAKIKINRKSIPNVIANAAKLARDLMKEEMAKSLISLKIDSASRGNRQIFAINCQYYLNGKMVIRNLVVKEMHERQTKENLGKEIEKAVQGFDVDMKQVYTIANDNGRNMVAAVKLLKTMLEKDNEENVPNIGMLINDPDVCSIFEQAEEENDGSDDEEEQLYEADGSDDDVENDDFSHGMEGDDNLRILATLNDPEDFQEILDCTRCAAHTAQLAVWDVIGPYKVRIAKIQKLVVKLRHREYHKMFKTHNAHLPPIANTTRWNSTYLMLKSLLVQRPFFNLLKNSFPETDFTRHWQFIEKFCQAFEPAFILTLKLQRQHVPLSEFYSYWLVCQSQLSKLTGNVLAKRLMQTLRSRSSTLTETLQFKASLYLDPRFNFLGSKRISSEDKEKVQVFLLRLYQRMNEVEGQHMETAEPPKDDDADNDLEDYLTTFFQEDNIPTGKSHSVEESILSQIKELELREKVPMQQKIDPSVPTSSKSSTDATPFDVLQYWESRKVISPVVYRLAKVVLAAPSTQVSVERAFSALKLILTDLRMRLSEKSIEDIMLLKLNPDLLSKIAAHLTSSMVDDDDENDG